MQSKHSRNNLSPAEVKILRQVEDAFRQRCLQFGYQEIKTATIEHQYIFTAREVLSPKEKERMIDFFDKAEGWGGEPVVLRPDSSPCVARYFNSQLHGQSSMTTGKFCYVENQFVLTDAKDAISERWQCGVEHIGRPAGNGTVHADIEVLFMAYDIIRELSEETILLLSYPAIIKEMARIILPDNVAELLSAIRKKDRETVRDFLAGVANGDELENLLALKGESVEYLNALKNTLTKIGSQTLIAEFENFITLCTMLDHLGCEYFIDFSLLGQTDYYTGIRFQITADSEIPHSRDILAVGGRYDNLIGNMYENIYDHPLPAGNGCIPATGFALYLKNIIWLLGQQAPQKKNLFIHLAALTRNNLELAQNLWQKMNHLGFDASIVMTPPSHEKEEDSMVIEVDTQRHPDGFHIVQSRTISKSILLKMSR